MNIFIICPVRNVTDQEREQIKQYVTQLEDKGYNVYWPERDTDQIDSTGGVRICNDNRTAIINADEVHVFWNGKSQGSYFDLGMAFALSKVIRLINTDQIKAIEGKSFNNVLLGASKNSND